VTEHIADLHRALAAFRTIHGWGRAIALPQLGILKRIVVFDLGTGPFAALNPRIEWLSPETFEVWDDCMCLPSIAVKVRRARSLTLSFLDEYSKPCRLEQVAQQDAELIQHELDHLDGILFTDRMIYKWGVIARDYRDRAEPLFHDTGERSGSRKITTF
jgi:peptide deformylase